MTIFSSVYEKNSMHVPLKLIAWIRRNVRKPIKGFEMKRNKDGSFYSYEQQLRATWWQVAAFVDYFIKQGKSRNEIIRYLTIFTKYN